jgi:hypothetical protein
MATKNLARTVIEGGRTGYSKYDRKARAQKNRAREHRLCRRLAGDPDRADGAVFVPSHLDWDAVSHADRTNPCRRFLISRAGRPWDEVYSEICRKFDRRTLPGRHVIEGHLLHEVERHRIGRYGSVVDVRTGTHELLYVDAKGILRYRPQRRR